MKNGKWKTGAPTNTSPHAGLRPTAGLKHRVRVTGFQESLPSPLAFPRQNSTAQGRASPQAARQEGVTPESLGRNCSSTSSVVHPGFPATDGGWPQGWFQAQTHEQNFPRVSPQKGIYGFLIQNWPQIKRSPMSLAIRSSRL